MHKDSEDIIAIREWLTKEPHLPQDLDDKVIKKYLHACKWSLESTKKCLDRFCSTRYRMTELYTSRDPLLPSVHHAFCTSVVSYYNYEKKQIIIYKMDDSVLDKFSFYDSLKTIGMQADHWIKYDEEIADGHYIILDLTYFSWKFISKLNIMYLKEFLIFLLEGMPVRVKRISAINAPSHYDKLYALIKPVLPKEICDIIHFSSDYESLHKFIDKKYLPSEYGGEAQSMCERSDKWIKQIKEDRKFFLNDQLWKADLKLKSKSSGVENTMSGSFRTLAID